MEFQEYPKSLYMGGDCEAEHVIVGSGDEEDAKRACGFLTFAEKYEADQKEADPAEADGAGHTVESVRASLDAAGIAYDKRLGLAKLVALLPKE